MKITMDLEEPEYVERLTEAAVRERRPVAWQAEVMLKKALRDWGLRESLHLTTSSEAEIQGDKGTDTTD